MVFTTEGFLKVAIENWREWDVGFERTTTEFRSEALTDWATGHLLICTVTSISLFFQCQILFPLLPSSVATFILIEIFLRQSRECRTPWLVFRCYNKIFSIQNHGGIKEKEKQLWKTAVFRQLVFTTRGL